MMCSNYGEENKMELKGRIKSGLGNARIWVEKASKIFEEKYNMKLFLGTLNVELNDEIILDDEEKILPHEYGGEFDVLVKKCRILGHKAYILRTEKNNTKNGDHPLNIIEIVTDINMRKTYNLKDEDEIIICLK